MNDQIETVGEVDKLIIGQKYLVPHVEMADGRYQIRSYLERHASFALAYCPVIGDFHEDRVLLGVTKEHFHIDWRFFPEEAWNSLYRLMVERGLKPRNLGYRVLESEDTVTSRIEMREAIYERVMPEFPRREIGMTLAKLQPAFKRCNVKDTMICPHRNVPLRGLEERNGCVRCPAHGMTWNIQTGDQATVSEMYRELMIEGVD